MSMRQAFRFRMLLFVLALILAGSGLVILLMDNSNKVIAAETDSAPGQCDQNYTFCRAQCGKDDDKCLMDCRKAYDACRRRGMPDR
ncbi:hypothetical protein HAP41_0000043180 [Bradyrhizobium barranii subsp. apii]|uniref:Uncharacterized protein n=1 Tax=Bradyrhizobium barranii subsp. apii TaxID=2819348 RepID=A0A8T5UX29_9BRAD|nr:hypothetical protein [Bradyrhizobium barranii]UPT86951.1 hypothetical protein HAP41_0000043180 [Bradyrhizobium barranii subsp. apii]